MEKHDGFVLENLHDLRWLCFPDTVVGGQANYPAFVPAETVLLSNEVEDGCLRDRYNVSPSETNPSLETNVHTDHLASAALVCYSRCPQRSATKYMP